MFDSTYKMLSFFEKADTVYGRKKLQKMIYLMEIKGHDFPFKFEYHHYGPYSATLQDEINSLVDQGLITEERIDEAYVYKITPKGTEFKQKLEAAVGYHFEVNEFVLKSMRDRDSQFLEMVSTYVFLLESGYTETEAKKKALDLKPHLKKLLKDAIDFSNQTGLIN